LIVLCDVDGVIANFTAAVLDVVADVTGERHPEAAVDQWSIKDALRLPPAAWRAVVKEITAPGFAYGIEPYPLAVAGVKRIAARSDLYFVTSPWWTSNTWMHDRTDWLVKYFGQDQGHKVIHTSHKSVIRGDALIEDKPETLSAWLPHANDGAQALLMDRPYNKGPHGRQFTTSCQRVFTWADIEGQIK